MLQSEQGYPLACRGFVVVIEGAIGQPGKPVTIPINAIAFIDSVTDADGEFYAVVYLDDTIDGAFGKKDKKIVTSSLFSEVMRRLDYAASGGAFDLTLKNAKNVHIKREAMKEVPKPPAKK